MAQQHWMERVMENAQANMARTKAAMRRSIGTAALRRPNTTDMVQRALEDPASLPPVGRERLAAWLQETYGEAARFVAPYLGLEEDSDEAQE